jgi:hypothetical protein
MGLDWSRSGCGTVMEPKTYSFTLKLLSHEIFSIQLASSDTSNKWVALSIITMFSTVVVIGAYGEKFIRLYQMLFS